MYIGTHTHKISDNFWVLGIGSRHLGACAFEGAAPVAGLDGD